MHVRVSPPAVATALRDTFRLQGLVSLLDEHGVVEVHAIGKWKTRFPQADAQLIDYCD